MAAVPFHLVDNPALLPWRTANAREPHHWAIRPSKGRAVFSQSHAAPTPLLSLPLSGGLFELYQETAGMSRPKTHGDSGGFGSKEAGEPLPPVRGRTVSIASHPCLAFHLSASPSCNGCGLFLGSLWSRTCVYFFAAPLHDNADRAIRLYFSRVYAVYRVLKLALSRVLCLPAYRNRRPIAAECIMRTSVTMYLFPEVD